MCVCSGSSWGWMEDNPASGFDELIHMLVNVVCRDGNLLLNVAPDRNGKLSGEITGRMREIGAWLVQYGESVYGTRGGPFEPVDGVFGATYRDNTVYLHILDMDRFSGLRLPYISNGIISCTLFERRSVGFSQDKNGISISLPGSLPEEPDTVVKLVLDDTVTGNGDAEIYLPVRND